MEVDMEREALERNGNFSAVVTITRDGKPVTLMHSLRTRDRQKANRSQSLINDIMTDVELGKRALPEGVAAGDKMFWRWLLEWNGEEKKVEKAKNEKSLDAVITDFVGGRALTALAKGTKELDIIYAKTLRAFMSDQGKSFMAAVDADAEFFAAYKTYRLQRGVKPQTFNKERAWLSRMCKKTSKVFKVNPFAEVEPEKKQINQERFRTGAQIEAELAERKYPANVVADMWDARILTKQEIGRFLKLALTKDEELYPMLVVAACTGARRGEIARLKWADVDFKSRVVWLMSRKGSRQDQTTSRDVYMTKLLSDTLDAQKLKTSKATYVFPSETGAEFDVDEMTKRINALTAGTEFDKGCGWHCFRHSVASIMAAEGKDRREINAVLGHVTEDMERRYRHLMPQQRKTAVQALQYKIG
jgi:integrase